MIVSLVDASDRVRARELTLAKQLFTDQLSRSAEKSFCVHAASEKLLKYFHYDDLLGENLQ